MVPADAIARLIHDAFADYHARFAEITRRAKTRFETQDWAAARADAVERIELYDQCIAECALRLQSVLLGQAHDRSRWMAARAAFEALVAGQIDRELYKTFYNTLSRLWRATGWVIASVGSTSSATNSRAGSTPRMRKKRRLSVL